MQYGGNTDYEKILTDVRSEAEPRTNGNIEGGNQVVLVYNGIKFYRKVSQEMDTIVCDISARFTKKKEQTIFGPSMAMVYFRILILKKQQRVTFIVMQYCWVTDYEQILTDVRSGADTRTGVTIAGGNQVKLYGVVLLSAFIPEGSPRSGVLKGISVYHRDTSVIVLQ